MASVVAQATDKPKTDNQGRAAVYGPDLHLVTV